MIIHFYIVQLIPLLKCGDINILILLKIYHFTYKIIYYLNILLHLLTKPQRRNSLMYFEDLLIKRSKITGELEK